MHVQTGIINDGIQLTTLDLSKLTPALAGKGRQGRCAWLAYSCMGPIVYNDILSDARQVKTGSSAGNQVQTWFLGATSHFTGRNSANHPIEYEVYSAMPRRDLGIQFYGPATQAQVYQSPFMRHVEDSSFLEAGLVDLRQPTSAATFAVTQSATAAGGAVTRPNIYDYSFTPYMCPVFCSAFKIKKITGGRLAPGGEFVINKRLVTPRRIGYQALGIYNTGANVLVDGIFAALRQCGPVYYVKIRGTMIHNDIHIGSGLDPVPVTMGNASLDCTHVMKFKYGLAQVGTNCFRGVTYYSNSFSTRAQTMGTAGTPLNIVDEDQVEPVAPAEVPFEE